MQQTNKHTHMNRKEKTQAGRGGKKGGFSSSQIACGEFAFLAKKMSIKWGRGRTSGKRTDWLT